MTVVYRTDDAPAADRSEYWRHVLGDVLGPIEPYTDSGELCEQLVVGDVGAVRVAELSASGPGGAEITRRHLARRSDPGLCKIDVLARGRGVVQQNGRAVALEPGDLTLVDLERPVRWAMSGITCVAVVFPRVLLPIRPDDVTRLAAVRIPGDEGAGALVSSLARQMVLHLGDGAGAERARLGTAVLDLLAVALAGHLDREDELPAETRQRALLRRILAFIEEQLGDPELSPRTIAAAHHVSLCYLYKLFEAEGPTVAEWIRRRRLERCRRDLLDPALRSRPVSAIGARWGLVNPAHFSRLFRAAYGAAPVEYRATSAQR